MNTSGKDSDRLAPDKNPNYHRPSSGDSSLSVFPLQGNSSEFIKYRENTQTDSNAHSKRPPVLAASSNNFPDVNSASHKSQTDMNGLRLVHDDFDSHGVQKTKGTTKVSIPEGRADNSWEIWWLQSQLWKRQLVFLLLIFFIIALLHFFVCFYVLFIHEFKVHDPYVCRTRNCQFMSQTLKRNRDDTVSPCENFYEYVCGNHLDPDTTSVRKGWNTNFAQLDAGGVSILADMLNNSDLEEPLAKQTIEFFKGCMDTPRRIKSGLAPYTKLIKETFGDIDLWNVDSEPSLEMIAVRVLQRVGDMGFFQIQSPINHPRLYIAIDETYSLWMQHATPDNLKHILPTIYDALGVPNRMRNSITNSLLRMTALWRVLIRGGTLPCNPPPKFDHYFDFNFPIWYVFVGKDSIEPVPMTNDRAWKLKNDSDMIITPYPEGSQRKLIKFTQSLEYLKKCWNPFMQRINAKFIRATYATFWSITILYEMINELHEDTAVQYKIHENPMFDNYKNLKDHRLIEYECFDSLTKNMGHLPVFRLSLRGNITYHYSEVKRIINQTAMELVTKWGPPEEGGLPFLSSFYRKRALDTLLNIKNTSILVPFQEDDDTFPPDLFKELNNTYDHFTNAAIWRKYVVNRTFHFWSSGSPTGKHVWDKLFYSVEAVLTFEKPGFADFNIVKFPISFFREPYWNIDMLLGSYSAAYYLTAKSWLKLIFYVISPGNVREDREYHKQMKTYYTEGIFSDGNFTPCQTIAYNWRDGSNEYTLEHVDPHFLAFRYGIHEDEYEGTALVNNPFYNLVALKTAYDMYFRRIAELNRTPFWKLNARRRSLVMHKKLVGFEEFSQSQLFFMNYMRVQCRSPMNSTYYNHHVLDSITPLMHSEEFSRVWHCPPGAPMNPSNKCYPSL